MLHPVKSNSWKEHLPANTKKTALGGKKGEDCGSGRVYLRKVITSDFYVEPFLRNILRADSLKKVSPPVKKQITATKPPATNSTVKKKPVTETGKSAIKKSPPAVVRKTTSAPKPPTVNKSIPKTSTTKIEVLQKQKNDSIKKIIPPEVKETILKPSISVPDVLKSRENALVKTLTVHSPEITIKLYDNGVIDGDTISVYVDKKLVLSNKGLSAAPITLQLKMSEDNDEHEVTMVAENLGSIPPNTSL